MLLVYLSIYLSISHLKYTAQGREQPPRQLRAASAFMMLESTVSQAFRGYYLGMYMSNRDPFHVDTEFNVQNAVSNYFRGYLVCFMAHMLTWGVDKGTEIMNYAAINDIRFETAWLQSGLSSDRSSFLKRLRGIMGHSIQAGAVYSTVGALLLWLYDLNSTYMTIG